ncbi:unnamed protein product [Cercospora beticola]|nr:unnamed protein product [Cercospora beticola]
MSSAVSRKDPGLPILDQCHSVVEDSLPHSVNSIEYWMADALPDVNKFELGEMMICVGGRTCCPKLDRFDFSQLDVTTHNYYTSPTTLKQTTRTMDLPIALRGSVVELPN